MAGLRHPQPGCYSRTAAAVNLLLGVFQVLLPCCRPGGAQGQAIEPLPNVVELWQAEEGELLLPTQGDSEEDLEEHSQDQSFSNKLFNGRGLHFQPSVLDFGIQFLGHPAAKILYAYNPSRDREVVVNSVFTAARHFHVPPVHCRVIPAMGKTSFRIIFLPTEEGNIESSLFINTSSYGVLSYHVSGVGSSRIFTEGSAKQLPNAYFLLPQVQSIQLSQTQAETTNTSLLQVQLECSLHNKVCQRLKSCYLESDDVLRLQMSIIVTMENSSKEFEQNTQDLLDHLSIIYVATDKTETSDDSAVHMYVLHSGNSFIWIQDVRHFSQRDALSLQFEPVLLPSSTTNFTKIASFTCKAASCDSGMKDVRTTKNTPTLKACLASPVVPGYFRMDSSAAQFHLETHRTMSGVWTMWCRNHFDRGIVLNGVFISKEAKHLLKILNFIGPLFLPPGCWNIFSLKLAIKDISINLFTNIFLTTNIGAIFVIPLQIYSAPTKEGSLGFEVIAHCGMHYFMGKSKAGNPHWESSLSLDRSTWDADSELTSALYERWRKLKDGDGCKRTVLGMTQFAHLKKSKEPESIASFLPRLVAEPGRVLNFSATALRNSVVQYFMVKNPSSLPVSLQLLPLSLYPKPEAAMYLLNRWFGANMQMINFTTGEFQLSKACPYRGRHSEGSRFGSLHFHLQPLEMKMVGVVFTPADYGKVTSLILIRNNLTIIDMIGVEGFGARELLKVGGRLPGPGGSLRFKVPESTLMDCRRQLKDSKQILSITKNFKVENIGPLPITVTSLKINGYNCQGYGFEVLDCHQFSLQPNTSRDISIVFTPDFTSSWVIRELTLVTAADLEFHFTLNVTLPHHLLPLCADVVPGPSWEESFWRLTVFFVSLSLLGVILIAFQQAQYILTQFMKTRQRQSTSGSSQQNSSPMDVISSHAHKSNCKNFLDTYGPSDKGRGKSCLPVNSPPGRVQNAAKRSPASYGHSQKKHKCSVYYNKHKPSASLPGSATVTTEDKQTSSLTSSLSAPKEHLCTNIMAEDWANLKYASGINVNLQKNLTFPKNLLNKAESTLKNTIVVRNPSLECHTKEGIKTCMFPKETDIKISENIAKLKEQVLGPVKTSKKLPENHLLRNSPQYQSDLPEVSRKNHEKRPPPNSSASYPVDTFCSSLVGPVVNTFCGCQATPNLHRPQPTMLCDSHPDPYQIYMPAPPTPAEGPELSLCWCLVGHSSHRPQPALLCDAGSVASKPVPGGKGVRISEKKGEGNNQQLPVKNEVDNCETLKKLDTKSSEKKIHKASKEDLCSEKQDIPSVEQEDPCRKKKVQEKKEGNLQNLNWNKNRTCRKNKKRGATQGLRPSEQSELKLACSELERSRLTRAAEVRSWGPQESSGGMGKADAGVGRSFPATQRDADGCLQKPGKKGTDKSSSDSSSDCGSSSGSVRASRGSWGSWSSSSSSSDGDKKPAAGPPHFLPAGDHVSQNGFPSETPISLNLCHNICNPTDVSNLPQYTEAPCPSLPVGPAGLEEDKGPYPPGDLWPAQPICVTGGFSCALESPVPGMMQGPAPVHHSSFIDWSAACEGQFPSVYCPLELNDYNAFPEENMNYPNGFPCPAEIQTDFTDHNSPSTWNTAPNVPTAWGHASLVSNPPYLTSARSLSPMSGLFGSIWAPQSDLYENCCAFNSTTEHPAHMDNPAVMCKEYYPGFNPFRAYMNLDIWTPTANRNANFPLSRDSSYCGNM